LSYSVAMSLPLKKVFIKSYGCQMNVYDSTRMADILVKEGYESHATQEGADLILLNTCHIREKAVDKIYSELGRIKEIKDAARREGRAVKVGIAGCVAQAEGEEMIKRAPIIDLVVGPQNYHTLPELLKASKKPVSTTFPLESKFDYLPRPQKNRGLSAFLTVQEGCDKFCTFCVVPYTRGAEVSRSVRKIVQEAQILVADGVKDITLLGQNVNAYHGEFGEDLPTLFAELSKLEGLLRLRYSTSHPNEMSDALIAAHVENEKLMPFLHLPVQSGSDKILDSMNRKHTRQDYFDIITKVREKRPDIALSSDFIVGFPGESDDDFEATMDLVTRVTFAQNYSFKYSPRPGTPASSKPQIDEAVKAKRLHALQALLAKQADAFLHNMVGRETSVLFEKKGRLEGQIAGRSPYAQPVQVMADAALIGTMQRVKITGISSFSLFAEVI
jgi:tRNA-2-methylthio-N6-dimethylallyladenosine synthase